MIACAAIVAARSKETLPLLVSLGFVGLLIAFLFLWFSAPDLALDPTSRRDSHPLSALDCAHQEQRQCAKERKPVEHVSKFFRVSPSPSPRGSW